VWNRDTSNELKEEEKKGENGEEGKERGLTGGL